MKAAEVGRAGGSVQQKFEIETGGRTRPHTWKQIQFARYVAWRAGADFDKYILRFGVGGAAGLNKIQCGQVIDELRGFTSPPSPEDALASRRSDGEASEERILILVRTAEEMGADLEQLLIPFGVKSVDELSETQCGKAIDRLRSSAA